MKRKNANQELKKANQIIKSFADAISAIKFDNAFLKCIEAFLSCEGKIVTAGIGKAGTAMVKFSTLLCSLGFPSCYLHPGEASHGDLGLLTDKDILFIASTSGKTREVIELINLSKNIGVKTVIGITSHKDSPIRTMVDHLIDMGEIKEAGCLGLAPTTSILVMLAITDTLALCSSERKGFTKADYALRHHGGYIGSKARGDNFIK